MPDIGADRRSTLKVDIRPAGESRFKVVWTGPDESSWLPYEVSRSTVVDGADEVRRRLADLVKASLVGPGSIQPDHLVRLAMEGAHLRRALFSDVNGGTTPEEVQAFLRSVDSPLRIVFVVDGYVHVPWGLMFDGDPQRFRGENPYETLDAGEGFWCFKYLVSTLYNRLAPRHQSEVPLGRFYPVMHRDQFALSCSAVDSDERAEIEEFIGSHGGAIHSTDDLSERWAGDEERLLLFYCHSDGQRLALSADDTISAARFASALGRPLRQPRSLVFTILNGCCTSVGDPNRGGGFVEPTSFPGFCGFIGTETEVPNVYGLRFCLDLARRVLSTGAPIADVLDDARRRHWPLSLMYGLYGYALFRVRSDLGNATWSSNRTTNFSQGPLGARRP